MPTPLAMIDGEIKPLADATIFVTDRGVLYGDSVFETLRTYGGRPFLLDRHLERLERSAEIVRMDIGVSRSVLESEVLATLGAARNDESYVRVTVTRGAGAPGLGPWLSTAPCRIVLVLPLTPPPEELYERGIAVVTFRFPRDFAASPANGAKTGNYLDNVLALGAARDRGATDALIRDATGLVLQGASSNVFFVEGGRLVTPPVECGILAGITRSVVLDLARRLGIPVELRAPHFAELGDFAEIFLSSSVREIVPVVTVDGRAVGEGRPGPVFEALRAEFRQVVSPNS